MFRLRLRQNGRCHGVTVITIHGATMATTGVVTKATAVEMATVPTGAMITMVIVTPVAIHLISGTGRKTRGKQKMRTTRKIRWFAFFYFNVILGS